jgi:HEAT repeat protein
MFHNKARNSGLLSHFRSIGESFSQMIRIRSLVGSLKNPDSIEAISSLAEIGEPAIRPLVSALYSGNPIKNGNAASALLGIGPPTFPFLIARLRDYPHGWFPASRVLSSAGLSALSPLMIATKHKSPETRIAAALTIAKSPHPYLAIPTLIGLLEDRVSRVRSGALDALFLINPYSKNHLSLLEGKAGRLEWSGNASPAFARRLAVLREKWRNQFDSGRHPKRLHMPVGPLQSNAWRQPGRLKH